MAGAPLFASSDFSHPAAVPGKTGEGPDSYFRTAYSAASFSQSISSPSICSGRERTM